MRFWSSFIIVVGLVVFLRRTHVQRPIQIAVLAAYIASVLTITPGSRRADIVPHVTLNLFHVYQTAIGSIAEGVQKYGWKQLWIRLGWSRYQFISVGSNILLFIPLGFLVPSATSFFQRWWKVLLLGFAFSLAIETVQLITQLGWFDASDLLHNTLGALTGYGVCSRWLEDKSPAM